MTNSVRSRRYLPSMFKLSEGGVPVRKVPAPLARRFQQICTSIVAEALAGADVAQLEFAALVFIADVPGIEQWRLAEAMGVDRNSASILVDQLEEKGLVERRVNSLDRRARELYLTRRGESAFETLRPRIRSANERILAPLSRSDRTRFIELLVKLIEGNSSHARPGAGRRKRGSVRAKTKRRADERTSGAASRQALAES